MNEKIRLHKYLALCGIGSRRKCEELILQGCVSVNNCVVTALGMLIEPEKDTVLCNGERVKPEKKIYIILNKPKGFVCTRSDEKNRPTVFDLIPFVKQKVFTVGRLDVDSEGLLIITNDGELANLISHPKYEVPKTYLVAIKGKLNPADTERIMKGVWLSEGKTMRIKILILKRTINETIMKVTIREGKKREIRRVFARFGHKVKHLKRISIGGLNLGDLKPGQSKLVDKNFIEKFCLRRK